MKIKTLIIAFCVLLLASCAVPKGEQVVRKRKRLKTMSDAKIYKQTVDNYLEFNNLNLKKVTINYEEGDKKRSFRGSFRGSLRILKDSIIWLSISKMGIEGMRVKLTPDSVAFIDRLHRQYMTTSYDYLNEKFNIELDYFLIQSFLTCLFFGILRGKRQRRTTFSTPRTTKTNVTGKGGKMKRESTVVRGRFCASRRT